MIVRENSIFVRSQQIFIELISRHILDVGNKTVNLQGLHLSRKIDKNPNQKSKVPQKMVDTLRTEMVIGWSLNMVGAEKEDQCGD